MRFLKTFPDDIPFGSNMSHAFGMGAIAMWIEAHIKKIDRAPFQCTPHKIACPHRGIFDRGRVKTINRFKTSEQWQRQIKRGREVGRISNTVMLESDAHNPYR